MTYQNLDVVESNGIARVFLNRPAMRNAFNAETIAELTQAFEGFNTRQDIRVVVLAARGAAFCAGADLNWMCDMAGYSYEENLADASRLARMLLAIYKCSKPVIARVHGDCYAGGVGLAAACDVVIASERASFCLSEVRLGLIPATIAPYVIRAMGEQAARRYFVTAEAYTASDALRIGFAHAVVPSEELDEEVSAIVTAILKTSPHAVSEAKQLVRDMAGRAIDDALLGETASRIADIRSSAQGREGIKAFLEKRKPCWIA